jgi:serpin B
MRRTGLVLLLVGALLAAACGDDGDDEGGGDGAGEVEVQLLSDVEQEPAGASDPALAGAAVTGFGSALLAELAAGAEGNVVVSPLSIAIVLAMMEPGATGAAQDQVRALLGFEDAEAFHASMSALQQRLVGLAVQDQGGEGDPGELTLRLADRAYLQQDFPFEEAYLDAIGRAYGPVLYAVDYPPDPDAVAHEINRFVDDVTEGRIPELLADGTLTVDTVLTLVNALYLHASWAEPFEEAATEDGPFTRADGTEVTVPFLHGTGDSSAGGDGWVAASKDYVGGLRIQLVLPDEGRVDEVVADLPAVLAHLEERAGPGGPLAMPRFETRYAEELSPALKALGLTAPYEPGSLLGIAADDRLVLTKVVHETFLAVDEEGTEAAAATAAAFDITSAPIDEPIPVVLDRPFILRIVDPVSGATLFLGLIGDPTA